MKPKEPTADQCSSNTKVFEDDDWHGFAIWYPQMGGYSGKAVAVMQKKWIEHDNGSGEGGCIDVWVWHDGEFPFNGQGEDARNPVCIHHCDPEQFINFGAKLKELHAPGRNA